MKLLDFPGLRKRLTLEPRFGIEVEKMAARLGLDPNYILSVMSIETAGTMDPAIQNTVHPFKDGFATGLIQFTPETARGLGTTVDALKAMTAVEQLQYVERFFRANGSRIRPDVPGDYYMAVFLPAFVGAPGDKVLGRKDDPTSLIGKITLGSIYKSNPGFDRDKDGVFTVSDVWETTLARLRAAGAKPALEVPAPGPLVPDSAPRSPSLPPQWRSSGAPSDLPVLRIGAKGTAVALAQVLLCSDVVTGVYTQAMADDYVRPFQMGQGIKPDAVIGPITWMLLVEHLKERPTEPPPP